MMFGGLLLVGGGRAGMKASERSGRELPHRAGRRPDANGGAPASAGPAREYPDAMARRMAGTSATILDASDPARGFAQAGSQQRRQRLGKTPSTSVAYAFATRATCGHRRPGRPRFPASTPRPRAPGCPPAAYRSAPPMGFGGSPPHATLTARLPFCHPPRSRLRRAVRRRRFPVTSPHVTTTATEPPCAS